MADTYRVERKIRIDAPASAVYERIKAGAGRMEIVDAVDDERVMIDQRNLKPFRSESTTTFALDDSGDGTAVTWSIAGPVTLITRIMGIFKSTDRMVGPVFEKGLARLKADGSAGM